MTALFHAYCYKSGEIELSIDEDAIPSNVIVFANGEGERFKETVSARARLAYDGVTLMVPGIPEAKNGAELEAFEAWHRWAFPDQLWYVNVTEDAGSH